MRTKKPVPPEVEVLNLQSILYGKNARIHELKTAYEQAHRLVFKLNDRINASEDRELKLLAMLGRVHKRTKLLPDELRYVRRLAKKLQTRAFDEA